VMRCSTLFVALLLGMLTQSAEAVVLYDGSSQVKPNDAPWLWSYTALNLGNVLETPLASHSAGPTFVTLNTVGSHDNDAAGYSSHFPNLLGSGRNQRGERGGA
jgi:hypothetical protein